MRYAILLTALFFCCGCAVGAATSGYALKAQSADDISPRARQSIIDEVKEWVKDNFQKN